MSAEDREQERGPQSAPSATGVSMRALLDSCAAADAISKPPAGAGEGAEARDEEEPSAAQPKRDAA